MLAARETLFQEILQAEPDRMSGMSQILVSRNGRNVIGQEIEADSEKGRNLAIEIEPSGADGNPEEDHPDWVVEDAELIGIPGLEDEEAPAWLFCTEPSGAGR